MDAVHSTVVGSACTGLELDAGSGHKVRPSDVCSVGDSRWTFSENDDVIIIMHTHHLCRTIHT